MSSPTSRQSMIHQDPPSSRRKPPIIFIGSSLVVPVTSEGPPHRHHLHDLLLHLVGNLRAPTTTVLQTTHHHKQPSPSSLLPFCSDYHLESILNFRPSYAEPPSPTSYPFLLLLVTFSEFDNGNHTTPAIAATSTTKLLIETDQPSSPFSSDEQQ
jgi:hypothetical protein